tara:strand:- start:88 stop:1587 length:1500 start_codon:yes stop_codon:yes gene_type:complete
MAKPLNQIELGTTCVIKDTGKPGTLQRIFHYPTKYLVKTDDGDFGYYSTHEITFEGYEVPKTSLKIAEIPYDGIGSSFAIWVPFQAESQVEHHFLSTKEIVWEMITSLETYNVWFDGIQRAIPDLKTKRYVHQYSFDKLPIKPGSYFKIRPASLAPWFRCRIITVEKEKEFGFDFRFTPLFSEYITFKIEESKNGVFVICNRYSKGMFSFLSLIGWNNKRSKILQRLAEITPVIVNEPDEKSDDNSDNDAGESRDYTIAVVVNKALDGDSDPLNSVSDVVTRGKAKALLIRIKRGSADRPTIPDKTAPSISSSPSSTGSDAKLTREQTIAMVVNKALDGDEDPLTSLTDKVTRAKAKALIVKIKRGAAERPPMPDTSLAETASPAAKLSPEQTFAVAINKAIEGDMEPINSMEDKVTRGKAKALLVKIKRGTAEAPPMPEFSGSAKIESSVSVSETDEQLMERLIAAGLKGDMEEINSLENKVLRGKIKAAIVKAKRKK